MTARAGSAGFSVRAWYAVGLLCLLSVISYLDRYVIALLAEPIGQAMKVDDTGIGLLMGLGFGVLYSLTGLPVAHLLDTRTRVRIVAVSVVVWSISTCASAFASSFAALAVLRAGVAIGEAALTPAAVSLIADLFTRERRTLPTATFMAVAAVMGPGAFIIGGLAYKLAGELHGAIGIEAWRLTMLFLGAPGLIVAPIWLATVREPARLSDHDADGGQAVSMRDAFRYILANLRLYGLFFAGLCSCATASFAYVTWTATILKRSFGMPLAEAGLAFGASSLVGGLSCALLVPALHALAIRRGLPSVIILLIAGGFALATAAVAAYPLAKDAPTLLLLATIAAFGFNMTGTPSVLAIQAVAPPRIRARMIALYVMAISLVGFTIGPPLGAWFGEHLFTGPDALRSGVALLAGLMGPLAVIAALSSLAGYRMTVQHEQELTR